MMIPEEMGAPLATLSAAVRLDGWSRRDFLRLLAAGCLVGGLSGCGVTSSAHVVTPPTPRPVAGRITPANAARIVPLATLQAADGRVRGVAWSPDGRRIACGTQTGDVLLWDAGSGARLGTWSGPPEGQGQGGFYPFAVWGVAWSPDGRQIVSTRYDGFVIVWDAATGASKAIPKSDSQPNTVAWAANGLRFALTDDQGKVVLWSGATAQRSASLERHDEAGWAYGLAWAPDSSMVASSRESGLLQLWDTQTNNELIALQAHGEAVWGLCWSPDGLRLASASDDGTARLWGVV